MDSENLRHKVVSTGHNLSQLLQLLEGLLDKQIDDCRYVPYKATDVIDMERADTEWLEAANSTT